MKLKLLLFFSFLLSALVTSAAGIKWDSHGNFKLYPNESLFPYRQFMTFGNNKIIETGYKEFDKKIYTAIYWIFSLDKNNKLKFLKKIDIRDKGVTSKKELKKILSLISKSNRHTAYAGIKIPATDSFVELFFSWFKNSGKCLYRIATLNNDDTISWTKFREFNIPDDGEIYHISFTATKDMYLFGAITVSQSQNTEKYTCYYNYGKIEKDKINWKYSSFKNMVIPWAKHEVDCCSLKDSYILLCFDPASVEQKYCIAKINSKSKLIFGDINSFEDFNIIEEPVYVPETEQVILPGEYKKDGNWIHAIAVYTIDYKKQKLVDEKLYDLPKDSTVKFSSLTYLSNAKKLLLTEYHNETLDYILASFTK